MRFPSQKALFAIAAVTVTVAALFALPAAADEPPKPSFTGVVEKTSRQLTTCTDVCGLRNLLFGSSESMTVAVRQTGPAEEVKPVAPKLVLQGQHSGDLEVVGEDSISFVEAADKTTQDHFTIDLSEVTEADEYTGALLFDTTSKAAQVSVPVIVKIREGPFWPLLILLGSVFLGWLITQLLNQRSSAEFRHKAKALREQVDGLPESERLVLLPLWKQMWADRGKDLARAGTRLTALTHGAEALRECRDIQDEALRSPEAAHLTPWIQRIGNATARLVSAVRSFAPTYEDKVALVAGTKDEFGAAVAARAASASLLSRARPASNLTAPYNQLKTAAAALQTAIDGVPTDATQQAPDLAPLLSNVKSSFAALEQAHGEPLEETETRRPFAAGIGEVAGELTTALGWPLAQQPAEAAAPAEPGEERAIGFELKAAIGASFGRAATFGVMLVVLAVGFKVTYLDNAIYGSSLTDYLTLVFWGLAAYGARQKLSGLGPTPAPTS